MLGKPHCIFSHYGKRDASEISISFNGCHLLSNVKLNIHHISSVLAHTWRVTRLKIFWQQFIFIAMDVWTNPSIRKYLLDKIDLLWSNNVWQILTNSWFVSCSEFLFIIWKSKQKKYMGKFEIKISVSVLSCNITKYVLPSTSATRNWEGVFRGWIFLQVAVNHFRTLVHTLEWPRLWRITIIY